MDRKYGTMDLPKRTEQMKGTYLKNNNNIIISSNNSNNTNN